MKDEIVIASVIALIFLAVALPVAYIASLPKPLPKFVDIHKLVENPKDYENQRVKTQAWLGDTGEKDITTILIPIVISTGKTTIIVFMPISDTDYYFGLYKDNSFTKGILIKLEYKKPELLGSFVNATGTLKSERVKQEGTYYNLYVLYGSVEERK